LNRAERQSALAIPVILAVGSAIAWAGAQGGAVVHEVPVFVLCGLAALTINWAAFVHAYLAQTERYFDLTGSVTYMALALAALSFSGEPDPRSLLIGALVVLWAVRLGTFLFSRIRADGSDGRFDALKPSFIRFLMTWTLQALWVFLTLSCGLAAMTAQGAVSLGPLAAVGTLVWIAGFGLEVVADEQKRRFRARPENRGRFITSGAWAWSRHPNYFGEICLWAGIALIALPVLSGWQYATLISPVFVFILLTRISGIPLLEGRAKNRWGEDPGYLAYRATTPVLVPRPPRTSD
jgi:steroid 5-alpha reductase family enzyme